MATAAAVLSILVKTQGVATAASELKGLDSSAKKSAGTFSKLGNVAKLAGGAAGIGGLAVGVKDAIGEFREAQKATAQTNAVLKSTGGAAKVTAKHVTDLANAISLKSGIDDEEIQSSENMLLTFTKVRNETGKGNKVFDQATKTITDMSVALGQSGKSSAIQLGKALNDPIKGITALRRVGVAFTEQQKKQIATLVKSGDVLGAQKIILKELNTEFGGSAAAQATAGDKLKVSLGNIAEAAGGVLVPQLDKAAKFMTTLLNQMMAGTGTGGRIVDVFKKIGSTIGDLIGTISGLVKGFKDGETGAVALGIAVAALTAGFIAYKVVAITTAAAAKAMAAAQVLLNIAMDANPIGLVVIALAALAAGLVIAYTKSETFRDIVNGTFAAVKKAAVDTMNIIGPTVRDTFAGIVTSLRGMVNIISGIVKVFVGVFTGDFGKAWDGVKQIFAGAIQVVLGQVRAMTAPMRAAAGAAVGAFSDGIKAAGDVLASAAAFIRSGITNGIRALLDSFTGVGGFVVNQVAAGIKSAGGAIEDAAKWLKDKIVDAVKGFLGIHSPSKVMMELGGHVVGGLIKGLTSTDVGAVIKSQLGGMVKVAGGVLKRGLVDIGDIPDAALGKLSDIFGEGHAGGGVGAGGPFGGFANMLATGSSIDAKHFPYVYGGGHGSFDGPYDCSGLVSAILHAGGLLGSPMSTDGLKNYGEEGPGKLVTIGVRGTSGRNAHTMMKLGNRYIESGGGHGAAWVGGWDGNFPIMRHPPGLARGGYGSGLTWVGERGPELANLPSGTRVFPNGQSMDMAGGGTTVVHHHHYEGPVVQGAEFLKMLRDQDAQYGRRNGKPAFGS